MDIQTTTDWGAHGGSCLSGYLDISYRELVEAFGEPTPGDGYKEDAEWLLIIDGAAVTVYNYKTGPSYCGSDGTPLEDERDWHVGGFRGRQDVDAVLSALAERTNA